MAQKVIKVRPLIAIERDALQVVQDGIKVLAERYRVGAAEAATLIKLAAGNTAFEAARQDVVTAMQPSGYRVTQAANTNAKAAKPGIVKVKGVGRGAKAGQGKRAKA